MKVRILMFALLIGLAASTALSAPPLADRLPADTMLYMGWAGRTAAFDRSMFGQLVQHPDAKKILASIQKAIQGQVTRGTESVAVQQAFEAASIVWRHPIALAVLERPAMAKPSSPARRSWSTSRPFGEGSPIPAAVLLVDLGRDRDAFDRSFSILLELIGEDLPIREVSAGGLTYKTVQPGRDAPVFSFGYLGETFFVTMGAEVPAALAALRAGSDRSLAGAKRFAAAYEEVAGDDVQFAMYLDVSAATGILRKFVAGVSDREDAAKVTQVMAALGVEKVSAIVSTTRIVDEGMYSKTRLLSPAPHRGVLLPLAGRAIGPSDLDFVPADADVVVAANINPSDVLAEIRRIANAIEPRAGKELDRGIAEINRELGISLEDDLLAHVGDQWTLVSAPSLGGFLTGTALVVDIKDEARFNATLARLELVLREKMRPREKMQPRETMRPSERMRPREEMRPPDRPDPPRSVSSSPRRQGPVLRSSMVGGTRITYVQIPSEVPVAPAWAVHRGKFILAAWPQVVRAVIEGTNAGSLGEDKAFQKSLRYTSGRPSILAYVNLPKIVRQLYGLPLLGWTFGANMLQRQGVDARPDWLPALPAVERFLWPSISTVSSDGSGITFESYGSMPFGALLSAAPAPLALGAYAIVPSVSGARERTRGDLTEARLQDVQRGIEMYEIEQSHKASNEARLASVKSNLQVVRSTIELYKIQHRGRLPAAAGATSAQFWAQLMTQTDETGARGGDFGPYLRIAPANPFARGGSTCAVDVAKPRPADAGWWFNPKTGEFKAVGTTSDGQDLTDF